MQSQDRQSPHETGFAARPDRLSLDNPIVVTMVPPRARAGIEAVWAFDRAMAAIVARAKGAEAMLAQLRLAWWREEIDALADAKSRPDPVLNALAINLEEQHRGSLGDILNAWETLLLAPRLGVAEAITHARNRGDALSNLSCAMIDGDAGAYPQAGEWWAATDLALHVDSPDIRAALFDHVVYLPSGAPGAPRALRALAGWSRRIATRQGRPAPLRDQLYLLRMGLIGR